MTFAPHYADPAPHSHFAVVHRLEQAFSAALPHGGLTEFRTTLADTTREGGWSLHLANGGVHHLHVVGGASDGGGGVLGSSAEGIVWKAAPDLVAVPEVQPTAQGRIRTADVEAWVAAIATNAAEVREEPDPDNPGQRRRLSWLKEVERESVGADFSGRAHSYGVYLRFHSGGGTFVYWHHVVPQGQQPRGEGYGKHPDAV